MSSPALPVSGATPVIPDNDVRQRLLKQEDVISQLSILFIKFSYLNRIPPKRPRHATSVCVTFRTNKGSVCVKIHTQPQA
jgi:hypothetical protein